MYKSSKAKKGNQILNIYSIENLKKTKLNLIIYLKEGREENK